MAGSRLKLTQKRMASVLLIAIKVQHQHIADFQFRLANFLKFPSAVFSSSRQLPSYSSTLEEFYPVASHHAERAD